MNFSIFLSKLFHLTREYGSLIQETGLVFGFLICMFVDYTLASVAVWVLNCVWNMAQEDNVDEFGSEFFVHHN